MDTFCLKTALDNISVKADWIGLREVKESTTFRVIRDLKPESNNISIDHGVMVEVLANGQFGYCATHDMSTEAINAAAEKAFIQANQASKFSSTSFTEEVRPKSVGEYNSPCLIRDVKLDDLMDILLKSNNVLKNSKKIVSAMSIARIVNTDMQYVSTNGSDFRQSFMYVGPGFRAIAQDGNVVQSR